MTEPTVSAIIPFRNYERTLEDAIRSALGQTYGALELVLVDDGSTDGSAALAQRYAPPATYLRRRNGGTGAARNSGVEQASGEFIAFCDADDVWAEDKVEQQMAVFLADSDVDVVFAEVSEFWGSSRPTGRLRPARTSVPGALPSAVLIRRAAFERVGPFGETWRVGEWADWYTRMRAAGLKEVWLPRVLVSRRLHPTSSGVLGKSARSEYTRILRAHLDRQRRSDSG